MNGIVLDFTFFRSGEMAIAKSGMPELNPGDVARVMFEIASCSKRRYQSVLLEGLAINLGLAVEYVQKLISACTRPGLLADDGEWITCPYIEKRCAEISEQNRKNAKSGRERALAPAGERSPPQAVPSAPIISTPILSNLDLNSGSEETVKTPDPPNPGRDQVGEFCWVSALDREQWHVSSGKEVTELALELANGWVGKAREDPLEFQKRRKQALNASDILRSWAITEAISQQSKRERAKQKPQNGAQAPPGRAPVGSSLPPGVKVAKGYEHMLVKR